jgi:hypothetical protein
MNFVAELKNDLAGLATLKDWLGDSMCPVNPVKSEWRASVCAPCLKNQPGDWFDAVKNVIADAIRSQLSLKKKINVSTSLDDRLGTCSVCSCNQRLKVHVPIEHIKKHTEEKTVKEFPAWCWVRQEI